MDVQDVERLIPTIYEAGCEEDAWSHIGEKLSTLFGDAGIGIDSLAPQSHIKALEVSTLISDSAREMHFEEYDTPEKNPGIAALLHAPVGQPFDFNSFVNASIYDRDPSIRGILHPEKIDKGLFVTLERDHRSFGFMSVFRRVGQPDFEQEELQALQVLAGHISRSCEFRRLRLEREQQSSLAVLQLASGQTLHGTMQLTPDGSLIEADTIATIILESHAGLCVRGGRLTSTSRTTGQNNNSLQRFLSLPTNTPGSFAIWQHNATLTLLDRHPVPAGLLGLKDRQDLMLVSIRCLSPKARPTITAFAAAYGLTNAEVNVVAALTINPNATKAATSISISRETMKSHLTHIYGKADINSLPQLMLLVGRFGQI